MSELIDESVTRVFVEYAYFEKCDIHIVRKKGNDYGNLIQCTDTQFRAILGAK